MKYKSLVTGDDGFGPIAAGDILTRDTEWARRALVNGLAEPLDDQAKAFRDNPRFMARYHSGALLQAGIEAARNRAGAVDAGETTSIGADEAATVKAV